jgi:hypothetical protein
MTDTRTISQLETQGCPWIGCECCKGTISVPFKMIRQKVRGADAQTLVQHRAAGIAAAHSYREGGFNSVCWLQ